RFVFPGDAKKVHRIDVVHRDFGEARLDARGDRGWVLELSKSGDDDAALFAAFDGFLEHFLIDSIGHAFSKLGGACYHGAERKSRPELWVIISAYFSLPLHGI